MIFQDFWNNCVVMRKKIVIFLIADIIGPDNSNVVCCLPWHLKWSESPSVLSDSSWPVDCTVHGILQARILEWVAIPFPRGSSQPRDRTQVSHIAGRFFTRWAIREALKFEGHAKFQLEISGGKKKIRKDLPWLWIPFILTTAVILRSGGWTLSGKPLSQGVSKHLITNEGVFGRKLCYSFVRRNF